MILIISHYYYITRSSSYHIKRKKPKTTKNSKLVCSIKIKDINSKKINIYRIYLKQKNPLLMNNNGNFDINYEIDYNENCQ